MAMKSFSIQELAALSGIRAQTIRIWEQRYRAFQPGRTAGNVRRYGVDDLARMLRIALLCRNGYRISSVCAMGEGELEARVAALQQDPHLKERMKMTLLESMYRMSTRDFESALSLCFVRWPAQVVLRELIVPFLSAVNLMRSGTRANEEHLVVTAVRSKLLWSIEQLEVPAANGLSIVLFLPGGRQLDLQLLYLHYELKRQGWEVCYLGTDVTPDNLKEILALKRPDYLLTYLPRNMPYPLRDLCAAVEGGGGRLLIAGADERIPQGSPSMRTLSTDELLRLHEAVPPASVEG